MHTLFSSCCINSKGVHLFLLWIKSVIISVLGGVDLTLPQQTSRGQRITLWKVSFLPTLCGLLGLDSDHRTCTASSCPHWTISLTQELFSSLFIGVPLVNSENCSGKKYVDEFSVIDHLFFLTQQKYNWHYKNIYFNNLVEFQKSRFSPN